MVDLLKKVENVSVAICGLGGLGSNIALLLARANVGKLILIDFDRVDESNINRQYYKLSQVGMLKVEALYDNLREINKDIKLECRCIKLTLDNADELLSSADIICEAFDDPIQKAMLVNYVLCNMQEKYLIAGSGVAGLDSSNKILTRKAFGHLYMCGDEASDVNVLGKLLPTRAMLCAAHQAHMVLRIINEEFEA